MATTAETHFGTTNDVRDITINGKCWTSQVDISIYSFKCAVDDGARSRKSSV